MPAFASGVEAGQQLEDRCGWCDFDRAGRVGDRV